MSQSALDDSLYALTEDEAAFFKVETGIQDDVQLKNHILAIQEEAYKVRVDISRDLLCSNPSLRRFILILAFAVLVFWGALSMSTLSSAR